MWKHRSDRRGRQGIWLALRRAVQDIHEAQQRLWLINHPWEERVLHWSNDGEDWSLHGELLATQAGPRAVTSSGWCLGQCPDVATTR